MTSQYHIREGLRTLFITHGGRFHGPVVETACITEEKFFPFLEAVIANTREFLMEVYGDAISEAATAKARAEGAAAMRKMIADDILSKGGAGWNDTSRHRAANVLALRLPGEPQ